MGSMPHPCRKPRISGTRAFSNTNETRIDRCQSHGSAMSIPPRSAMRPCVLNSIAARAKERRGRKARRSAPMCRPCSGLSPIPGATCSRTASPITRSRNSAVFTFRVRCYASSAAISAPSRRHSRASSRTTTAISSISRARAAMTSGRRRRSPTPRRSPGICRSTISSGRGCTSTSASQNSSRSAT